ncbi:recombinase family protein [Thauera humireducens]|uniref:recombinase family protein n=1 Tax=Thauera humireducens TaxID=1134435 RepID=UPI00311DABB0
MKMKAAVGVYARYSDDSQSPMSVEDQMRRALDYLSRIGIEATKVERFIDEDVSAYKTREAYARPAFNAMMAAWGCRRVRYCGGGRILAPGAQSASATGDSRTP